MFVVGLLALVGTSLLVSQSQWGRGAVEVQGKDAAKSATVQILLRKMVKEIQEGTRPFYPAPSKVASATGPGAGGVGIVNARGEAILYYFKPSTEPDRPGAIHRLNVNLRREGKETDVGPFLENIESLRVTVAPAFAGKEPSLVNLDLALRFDGAVSAGATPTSERFLTSIFLRNLERDIPDDPSHVAPPP
jgi:hypothetical protein